MCLTKHSLPPRRAQAADEDSLLFAALAAASPLRMMISLALFLERPPDCMHRCRGGILTHCRSPRHASVLLVVDELVHKSSKELEAFRCPVVCAEDLLEKR